MRTKGAPFPVPYGPVGSDASQSRTRPMEVGWAEAELSSASGVDMKEASEESLFPAVLFVRRPDGQPKWVTAREKERWIYVQEDD